MFLKINNMFILHLGGCKQMKADKLLVKLLKLIIKKQNPRPYDLDITVDEFTEIVDEAIARELLMDATWMWHLNKYVIHEKTYVTEVGQQFLIENRRFFNIGFKAFFKTTQS